MTEEYAYAFQANKNIAIIGKNINNAIEREFLNLNIDTDNAMFYEALSKTEPHINHEANIKYDIEVAMDKVSNLYTTITKEYKFEYEGIKLYIDINNRANYKQIIDYITSGNIVEGLRTIDWNSQLVKWGSYEIPFETFKIIYDKMAIYADNLYWSYKDDKNTLQGLTLKDFEMQEVIEIKEVKMPKRLDLDIATATEDDYTVQNIPIPKLVEARGYKVITEIVNKWSQLIS